MLSIRYFSTFDNELNVFKSIVKRRRSGWLSSKCRRLYKFNNRRFIYKTDFKGHFCLLCYILSIKKERDVLTILLLIGLNSFIRSIFIDKI